MFYILTPFWFIRETKAILFWLYLWQLKEYHIGRFIDHFRTEKGKQLLLNKLLILKFILLLFFILGFFLFGFGIEISPPSIFSSDIFLSFYFFEFFVRIPFLVLFLYIFEAVHASFNFFQKKIKKPVLTKKTVFLISIVLVLKVLFIVVLSLYVRDEFGYINFIAATFYLLLFDIFTPLIVSAIVLFFQPLAVLARNQIIKKAKEKKEKFKNLIVVGITGSYGKTSTKEFLATILSEKFKILKTKEHQNSEVGISQCILKDLKPEHEIFIVEMGAYNRGGIKLLCDIVKPKIGILTGINEQHMATFGSRENIIKGKYELIESLPNTGLAIFNGNNKYCLELYQKTNKPKKIIYSTIPTAVENVLHKDFWAENIKVEKEWIYFKIFASDGDFTDFKVNVLGAQNVLNILGAAAVANELGMSLKEISKACEKISEAQSGIRLIKTKDGLNIIDATYSANPDGVVSHLEYLKIWKGKRAIIMPCLIELGPASKEVHKRIGKKIGEICDLAIITTKERFKEIKEGASEKGMPRENILFLENPKEIFEKIKSFCQPGDIILLESRVPTQLISTLIK